MTVYPNPFESRASEHQRDLRQFVRTFGPDALDLVPSAAWDRLVILRSSPGAGKTSLMRLFSAEALMWASTQLDPSVPLRKALTAREILDDDGVPQKLGILLNLDRDYRALMDLPFDAQAQERLFLRLLDSRIMTGVVRAALVATGNAYPQDASLVSFNSADAEPKTQAAIEKMGGNLGSQIMERSRDTEQTVLKLLDAVLMSEVDLRVEGHSELLSIDVLEECTISVNGTPVTAQPLLMFDDGHELSFDQRSVLLGNLRRRRAGTARWYSERFEALTNQELLQGFGNGGRDFVEVDIDHVARRGSGRRFTANQHNRILSYIALARANPVLETYARESQPFFELLGEPSEVPLDADGNEIVQALRARALNSAIDPSRYTNWFEEAETLNGRKAAHRWREIAILVARDQRKQQDLFADPLELAERAERSSSTTREAAALSVATEFGLPYYGGREGVLALGSTNTEQFLNLCGTLFDEMLVDVAMGRRPHLTAERQDRLLRTESERYWEGISRTVPNGRDVRAIVAEIVRIAVQENSKPNVPYPPGVTGTALLMSERERLLDSEYRAKTMGAERLFNALASAVSYNVITADLDYSVKGNRYMVLYLNRLLCPRFNLPLGRGAFRERSLHQMLGWVQNLPDSGYRDPRLIEEQSPRLEL